MSTTAIARRVEPLNIASHIELLNKRYEDATPMEVLRAMIQDEFPRRRAGVSFGTESAALLI